MYCTQFHITVRSFHKKKSFIYLFNDNTTTKPHLVRKWCRKKQSKPECHKTATFRTRIWFCIVIWTCKLLSNFYLDSRFVQHLACSFFNFLKTFFSRKDLSYVLVLLTRVRWHHWRCRVYLKWNDFPDIVRQGKSNGCQNLSEIYKKWMKDASFSTL